MADHGHMDITDHKCLGDLYRKLPQQVKHYKHQKHQKHQSVKFKEKLEQETNYMIDRYKLPYVKRGHNVKLPLKKGC